MATDVRVGYTFDYFTERYTRFWQVFQAGAGHRFGWGPAYAGVNEGNLKNGGITPRTATELQFEAEAYPTLSFKNYAYLAYAYSPGSYFPHHRAAVELWQVLPKGWAVSAGLNYYYFDRNIYIGFVSVESIPWQILALRGCFVYFKDNGPTTSYYPQRPAVFNDIDYLQLTLGTGTAPDEPFDIQSDIMRLSANSIRLSYYGRLTDKALPPGGWRLFEGRI